MATRLFLAWISEQTQSLPALSHHSGGVGGGPTKDEHPLCKRPMSTPRQSVAWSGVLGVGRRTGREAASSHGLKDSSWHCSSDLKAI